MAFWIEKDGGRKMVYYVAYTHTPLTRVIRSVPCVCQTLRDFDVIPKIGASNVVTSRIELLNETHTAEAI